MNKERILNLIKILQKQSDIDHPLSIQKITLELAKKNITVANRKTLYNDFKILSELGYEVEYNQGYFLTEAPFSLSEIKIIIDSINSLIDLDDKFLNNLKNKIYSFTSKYDEKMLKDLEYRNKHSDKKFINRLEDSLQAIRSKKNIVIKRNKKAEEEISPIFLYRNRDHYYLYYHYPHKEKIYHLRFDNINSIKISNNKQDIIVLKKDILNHISESSNAYYDKKADTLYIQILNDSPYLRNLLKDDFANIVFTNEGFSIKSSINEALFAKLVAYGNAIKINDKKIAKQYIDYLNKIIICNQ